MEEKKTLSEKTRKRSNTLVLIYVLILLAVWIFGGNIMGSYILSFILGFALFIILIFVSEKIEYKLASPEDKAIMDERKIRGQQYRQALAEKTEEYNEVKKTHSSIFNIHYVSGFPGEANQLIGTLVIEKDTLVFYNKVLSSVNKKFQLPVNQIENTVYDTSSNITLGRVLMFGIGSLALKKKTNYLIIEYVSEKGINNQLVFETGSYKNMKFYNDLNTARNEYAKPIEKNKTSNITDKLRELAKLRDEGIVTEEEFNEKKKILLDKIN